MLTWHQHQNGRLMPSSELNDDYGPAFAARLVNPFVDHPANVGETYRQHLRFAAGFGGSMLAGGIACLVHAFFPFLFQTIGSRTVRMLHQRLDGRLPTAAPASPDTVTAPSHDEARRPAQRQMHLSGPILP